MTSCYKQGSLLKPTHILLYIATVLMLGLSACSPKESTGTSSEAKTSSPYEAVSTRGKGFTVGAMMSAQTVYVLFDPQCPHCGHLWESSIALQKKVKFVWIPVAIINASSTAQGAALLSAANPAELMAAHEKSILAGTGGITASASIAPDIVQTIKTNTQLFTSLSLESVPFITTKNMRTGQSVTHVGAMGTAQLAEFIGSDQP